MGSNSLTDVRRPHRPRAHVVLAVVGVWSVFPPYLGPLVGLELNVAANVEVVDHVVAGVLIVVCAGLAALLIHRDRAAEGSAPVLALTGICVLGGLWQVTTHAPLVLEGGGNEAPWDAVLLHSTPGPALLVIALWLALRTPPALGPPDKARPG